MQKAGSFGSALENSVFDYVGSGAVSTVRVFELDQGRRRNINMRRTKHGLSAVKHSRDAHSRLWHGIARVLRAHNA